MTDTRPHRPSYPLEHKELPVDLLKGCCHCGAVKLALPHVPSRAMSCNCSICRRLGAIWGVFDWTTVQVSVGEGGLEAYIWGEKTLRTLRCRNCGCATHWEPLQPREGAWHGVNLRMFPPGLVQQVKVRHFDGAKSWSFLD